MPIYSKIFIFIKNNVDVDVYLSINMANLDVPDSCYKDAKYWNVL